MNNRAQFFKQLAIRLEFLKLRFRTFGKSAADRQRSEHSNKRLELQGNRPAVNVFATAADVTAPSRKFWQMKIGKALMQLQLIQRILIVAPVVSLEETLHSPVGSSVSAGAVLQYQFRMFFSKSCKKFIDIFHISDPDGTASGCWMILPARHGKTAVHVYFEVVQRIFRNLPVDGFPHVFHDFRDSKIQQSPIGVFSQFSAESLSGECHDPLGMPPAEFAVKISGFQFCPDSKFHPERVCPIRQGTQSIREFFPMRGPVSDCLLPAGVQDKQFASETSRGFELFPDIGFLHFLSGTECRIGIKDQRLTPVPERGNFKMAAVMPMHDVCHFPETAVDKSE